MRVYLQRALKGIQFIAIVGLAIYACVDLFGNVPAVKAALQSAGLQSVNPPAVIHYQGSLRDASTNQLADGTYDFTFRIYDNVSDPIGAEVWMETHANTEVRNGIFSVLLGSAGSSLEPQLFHDEDVYLGVTVAPFQEMLPRQRFASVPFAFMAGTAANLMASEESDVSSPHMELRSSTEQPYLDFSNDDTTDADARLTLLSDDAMDLQGASLRVDGDISWNGKLTDLYYFAERTVSASSFGNPQSLDLGPAGAQICFLTGMGAADFHTGSNFNQCAVQVIDGRWRLEARVSTTGPENSEIYCSARCLTWQAAIGQ